MPRTAEKVRNLLEDGEEMEEALRTVKQAADENDGEVAWEDVNEEIDSGQWGRIIEVGILESTENGFRFRYPDEVDDILDSDDIESAIDLDLPDLEFGDTGWTKWDKAAAATAGVMIIGYYFDPLQNLIGGTVNIFLGPFANTLPFFMVIFIAALITALFSTLLYSHLVDEEIMDAFRTRMNAIQDKKQKAQESGDEEAIDYFEDKQMDMMTDQIEMFKAQFRPMAWIMLLVIPIFLWIWWMAGQGTIGQEQFDAVYPIAGTIEDWNDGIIGPLRSWIVWYIVCSISLSQILRKMLNIRMMQ